MHHTIRFLLHCLTLLAGDEVTWLAPARRSMPARAGYVPIDHPEMRNDGRPLVGR
jgi:hypothetical protein